MNEIFYVTYCRLSLPNLVSILHLPAHLSLDWPQGLNMWLVATVLDWLKGQLTWNPPEQIVRGGGKDLWVGG